MAGSIRRSVALVGLSLVVLAPAAAAAQDGPPARETGPDDQEFVLVIPPDWKENYPFSARFQATDGAAHVIDLAAARFATDALVDAGRGRTFREPDLSTFPASSVREAFTGGALVGAGRDLAARDLFIVQATDAKAQAALRKTLERARIPILAYVPNDAYLVRLDARSHSLLGAERGVFWIGLFQPAYRVAPDLDFILQADPGHLLKLRLRLDPETYASEKDVRAATGAVADATVVDVVRGRRDWIVRVDGPVTLARTFAALPGVLWVERFVDVRLSNNVARTSSDVPTGRGAVAGPIMDVEDVWARGIRGEGQIAAAADTGLSTGDNTTADSMHWDFGQAGSPTNPMRVIKGYALNDRGTWNDDQSVGGGHGTHTSGSIVGNGIVSGSTPSANVFPAGAFAGTAPKAGFVFQSVMYYPGPCSPNPPPCLMLPGDLNNLFLPPYNDGARVHSNSWGSPSAGAYDTSSETLDEFVWDHKDMVITVAAGNEGADSAAGDGVINPTSTGTPGTAKNCITVGASENYRPDFIYELPAYTCTPGSYTWGWFDSTRFTAPPEFTDPIADNASGMAAFSARGPTADGRFKPDIAAPGTGVISTRTSVFQDWEQWGTCNVPAALQEYYVSMGGTSMANPLTAGAATLVRQYYVDGWHANDTDVTESAPVPAQGFNPSAALVKATLLNGAWDMAPGQYGGTDPQPEIPPKWDRSATRYLPNNAEGYGRVDLEASLFPASGWGRSASRSMLVRDVAPGLVTAGRDSRSYEVGSTADPLVVTLVWTDPYALVAANPTLVNNLDLEVTSPSGKKYYVNKLDVTGASFVHDLFNTVEQVKVSAPETGNWTIDVVGTNVPGNAVPGSNTQPYALVVSGVTCAVPAAPTGVAAVVNGYNRIDVSWASVAGATEYRVYRGTAVGQSTTLVGTVPAPGTLFADGTVQGGRIYYYVVKAATAAECESARSTEVSATATGACTLGPAFNGLNTVTNQAATTCGMTLAWTAGTSRCGGTSVTYSVYRSTTSGFTPSAANRLASGLAASPYADTSALVSGTTYYYIVRATDEANDIEETNTVERAGVPTAGTGGQTLYGLQNFDALSDGSYAGWAVGTFEGSAIDWQRVQSCADHSGGGKVFRFGGTSCTANYTDAAAMGLNYSLALPPPVSIPPGSTTVRLSFWHKWQFEPTFDGAFLSISLNGTNFYYVPAAAITLNSYAASTNTYLKVRVWEDDHSTSFVNTIVNLDTACDAVPGNTGGCAGKTVSIGFTTITDYGGSGLGWFVDDVQVTATAPLSCSAAPQPLPFLSARATPGQNLLEWRNPTSGAYGSAMVRFNASATYPATATAGTQLVCPGENTAPGAYNSCVHSGLTNGTTYSYSVFVDNGAGVYSSRRSVQGVPFAAAGGRKWSYSTGAANLAPAGVLPGPVGTGAAFSVSNDRALHAMDPTTAGGNWPRSGSFDWTPAAMNAPAQHRPPVVPLAAGPRVFLATQDGYAYAVDARTGAVLWSSARLGDVLQANPAGLFSDLRTGAPNRVFVATRNATSPNALYALDPDDGHTLGKFDNGAGASAIGIITGITVDYDTNLVYFTSRASTVGATDTLWCVDAVTMAKAWSLALGDIDGSPALYGGKIYVGTNAGQVMSISPSTHAVTWTYTCNPADGPIKGHIVPHIGMSPPRLYFSTNQRVWGIVEGATTPAFSVQTVNAPSTPLYVAGTNYLLVGRNLGTLFQLNATSGATITSVSLGGTLGSPSRDSVNNLFYVGSTSGVLHALTLPVP